MMRALLLLVLMALPGAARAEDVAAATARAAADLQAAVLAMEEAQGARDRVAALTLTIRAYEDGLEALREALRRATIREAAMQLQFDAERERVGQLIGALSAMDADAGPLLLLHPAGALATARSGMLLAELTPALQAEVEARRAALEEARDLRALQIAAAGTLAAGLTAAQEARTALSQAMSDRTDLPRRFTEDPEALRGLLESADTLDAMAAGLLAGGGEDAASPAAAPLQAPLPWPVRGTILRRPGEADAAGVRRPGVVLATRPRALVTAPAAATIRYRGPLLDYGNVMILEPGGGYLLILAGLETVYGEVGEIVAAGGPVGLMGGSPAGSSDFMESGPAVSGAGAGSGGGSGGGTLYLEVRQGAEPVDPTGWFAGMQEQDGDR
jgi:septal ring factor EnvC (AmiA/AmiB activator)